MRTEHYAACDECERTVVVAAQVNGNQPQWVRCATCESILAAEPSSLEDGWETA